MNTTQISTSPARPHAALPAEPVPTTSPRWQARLLATAASLLVALAFGWLAREMSHVRGEITALRSRQQTMSVEHRSFERHARDLEAELARRETESAALQHQLAAREERITKLEASTARPQRAAAPVVASMVLSAGMRTDLAPALALPAAAEYVELRVDLEGDDGYRSFRATLTNAEGAQLLTSADLTATVGDWGSEVILRLPAGLFRDGVYELSLAGLDRSGVTHALGRHRFTVAPDR